MITMKNILIINHHATIPKYGGGGRHHQFSSELSNRGYNVNLIASSYQHGRGEYLHESRIVEDVINKCYKFTMIKSTPDYKNNLIKRLLNYVNFTHKVKNIELDVKPDVIIASSVHPFTWIAGYKLAKKYQARFVVEVRDLWPLSLYEDLNGLVRHFVFMYFNRLEKKYYNLADSIIVTAPNAHKYMNAKYKVDTNKIHFIPHSIDLEEFDRNVDRAIIKPIKKLLDQYFCITYTGSLSKSEGLENLLYIADNLKCIPEIKFLIIGSGSEQEALTRLKEELELDNVFMFDRLPREDVPPILQRSSVLFAGLMERKAFAYGISKNKFYDYMAAEKPVIFMSNVEDSAIEKAECGYVIKNHSVNDAVKKIKQIYYNKNMYNLFANNAREYVEKHHTIKRVTDQFIKALYK